MKRRRVKQWCQIHPAHQVAPDGGSCYSARLSCGHMVREPHGPVRGRQAFSPRGWRYCPLCPVDTANTASP
jgi:hypothetical protein